ncbi:MAG TPA: phosphatase PAP2 family protein [archaeon]|nr:phosphatase PAP2 family protein [archaeon]
MRKVIWICLAIFMTITQRANPGTRLTSFTSSVGSDYRTFYSLQNLGSLAAGLAMTGFLANTSLDEDVRAWYQGSVRNKTTDLCALIVKPLGDGKFTLPVYFMAAAAGMINVGGGAYAVFATWGSSTLFTLLMGVPPMLLIQRGLGSSSPDKNDSHWRPFQTAKGVSGHCFMGAVPFLTAVELTPNPYLKVAFYLASTLTGLSRINDDAHYLSQVFIGWFLAWLSASTVRRIRNGKNRTHSKKDTFKPVVTAIVIFFISITLW